VIRIGLEEIERPFKASFELLFRPKRCFERADDGYLTCAGQTAFSYWFLLTLLESLLALFAAASSRFYSIWYFAVVMTSSAVRMVFLITLWATLGSILNFSTRKTLASVCLFSSALFSLPGYLLLLFPYSQLSLEKVLANPILIGQHTADPQVVTAQTVTVVAILLTGALGIIYSSIYLAGIAEVPVGRALAFCVLVNLAYGLLRPVTVSPFYDLVREHLTRAPWQ
jgi:glucan phosphoethanolaminetransferase (alkaline phosphatase superfamily)